MDVISPDRIAHFMALVPPPGSLSQLDKQVRGGLPKSSLKSCVEHVCLNREECRQLANRLVPVATYKRRRDRFTSDESEKIERLARVFATAEYVWGSEDEARAFLHTPHPLLDNATPLDIASTELGARRVEALLWRLFHGIAA